MERRTLTFQLEGTDLKWNIPVQVCDCEEDTTARPAESVMRIQ